MPTIDNRFPAAASFEPDWQSAATQLAAGLGDPGTGVGILYVSEHHAPHLEAMTDQLRHHSGIADWAAAAGYGVITTDGEYFGEACATAMVLQLPPEGYRLFAGDTGAGSDFAARHADWLERVSLPVAITHVDPRHPEAARSLSELVEHTAGFLVGGLTAASGDRPHHAGDSGGCLSGIAISPADIEVATALSQGCTPIGSPHVVTSAQKNVLITLDGEPALDVFKRDIGEELARNLEKVGNLIFAALPVAGSDMADYTVRNLVGIDVDNKIIAIADVVPDGHMILFCRRDRDSAVKDMRRMTSDLKRRIADRPVRGGLYISCAGRGPNQFIEPERELDIIRETLGSFPVAGFFANGEISRDRIYAYTGILTLFL